LTVFCACSATGDLVDGDVGFRQRVGVDPRPDAYCEAPKICTWPPLRHAASSVSLMFTYA